MVHIGGLGPGVHARPDAGAKEIHEGRMAQAKSRAKHGHRPKHRATLRHPSLEMKIIGGVVVVVAVAAIGAPVVF